MNDRALKLGVNIDHVATLRQARGTAYPSVLDAAAACEAAGAHGITIHLREDRRHIQDADVYALRKQLATRMNLEMANNPDIVAVALAVRPDEVCLVPEKREELTTEGGLDAAGRQKALETTVGSLGEAGIEVSLFIDPEPEQIEAAAALRAPYIELHTGTYCTAADAALSGPEAGRTEAGQAAGEELERLVKGAEQAHALGLHVNAGHGLNLENLEQALAIPHLDTLNIGHSIVARSVFAGIDGAVKEMLAAMSGYAGGSHG